YDVRVLPTDAPTTSRQYAQMHWSILSTYINSGRFIRPNKVLIALRIKATNQLNGGIPNLNWRQKRMHVLVFNPRTRQYEEKSAQNPIWAAYDILHHCRRLKNISTGQFEYVVDGCPTERFSKYFHEWQKAADYADEMIDAGNGGTEKRFQLDAFFDTKQKRYEAANKAAQVGHATIVRHGVDLGIVVDMPGTIKQIFGEGRTIASSVSGSFASREERARSVQITYNDEQRDFKNTEFFVRSARYAENRTLQDNTANVTLFGVSRRSQAHREALYYLATNERQLQTIHLSADVNALVCEYGDIVGVAHTVPRLGLESGRIVSIDGNKVTLDKKVTLTASDVHSIIVQRSKDDVLITRDILPVTTDTVTDTVTVSQSFGEGEEVAPYDCYAIGVKNKVVKPFRVVKLEQDKDLKMTLTAIEYDEKIYEPDYTRYPIIDYSKGKSALLKAPINLTLSEENLRVQGSGKNSIIHCTWEMPKNSRYDAFRVSYSTDNYNWVDAPTTGALSLDLKNMEPDHTYYIRVRAILDGFESGYASAHIGVSGNILPATPVTGMTAYTRYRQLTGQAIYDVIVNWLPSSLTGRVYYKTSYASAENVIGTKQTPWGAWVFAGEGAGQLVIPQLLPGETIRVAVTTANELGEYTVPDAVEYLDVVVAEQTTKPLAPENLSIEFTDKVVVKWNAVTNTTIAYYEVRTNNAPGEAAGLLVQTTDLQAALPLTERQGTIFVLAKNTQGEYSSASELMYKKEAPKAPKAPNVKTGIGTLTITAPSFPVGVSKMHVRIIGQQHSTAFDTTSSVISYACESDIYDVSISFIDVFGPGAESGVTTVTVTATVDLSTLNREALGLDEIDKNIAKIEAEVGTVKSDVTGLQTKLTQTAEGLQQSVTDLKTNVQTQLSQFSNSIDLRVSNAIKGLDGDGLISRINLSTSGVRIDGKLIHVTGQALFDDNIITNKMLKAGSVSADKMQVESLDTISARIGTLRTATSGARTEIKDNLIEVYDDDNELRVRMGIWD
uniref:phage tail protein n=1 Tax=Megasphaera micronuciformis TaxID=187326 RepID=UPI00402737C5